MEPPAARANNGRIGCRRHRQNRQNRHFPARDPLWPAGAREPSPPPSPSLHPFSSGCRTVSSNCATCAPRGRCGQASGSGCARTFCKRAGEKPGAWPFKWSVSRRPQAAQRQMSIGRAGCRGQPEGIRVRGSSGLPGRLTARDPVTRMWIRNECSFHRSDRSCSGAALRQEHASAPSWPARQKIFMQPPWHLRFQQALAKTTGGRS